MNNSVHRHRIHICLLVAFAGLACGGTESGPSSTNDVSQGANDAVNGLADGASGFPGAPFDTAGEEGGEGGTTDGSETPAPTKCTSATDCHESEACDCQGRCVDAGSLPCEEQKNCGSGNYCDKCWGFCRPVAKLCEPCQSSEQCEGNGSACLDFASGGRFCGRSCLSDLGCPNGFNCAELPGLTAKQCAPKSGSCASPGGCQGDADCPFPQICNEDLLECAPGCETDASCPVGKVCAAARCVEPCNDSNNPCPAGQVCEAGKCKIPGGCLEPADCLEPQTYCNLATKMCAPGCAQDFDCKSAALICQGGKCVEKGCSGNFFCGFGQVCSPQGECVPAEGPYCATCNPDGDATCTPAGSQNLCVNFQNEEGQDMGAYCLVACGPDDDNPCPQGYQCQTIEVDGSPRDLCARPCYVPPI